MIISKSYVYAVALNSAGRRQDAIATLKGNLDRHTSDGDTLTALVGFSRDVGDISSALEYAQRLARLAPSDRGLAALIDSLTRQVESAK